MELTIFKKRAESIEKKKTMRLLQGVGAVMLTLILLMLVRAVVKGSPIARLIGLVNAIVGSGWLFIFMPGELIKTLGAELKVTSDAIECWNGGTLVERFSFREVNRVIIAEDKEGNVLAVRLKAANHGMALQGFENMNQLAEAITTRMPDPSKIQRKKTVVNQKNLLLIVVITMLITRIVLRFFQQRVGENAYDLISIISLSSIGLFLLAYRPSRYVGTILKRLETVSASFLLIFSGLLWLARLLK